MNNFTLRRAPAIGLALVMATLCGLVSLPTQAQVAKPALVRDIDNPALQPFRDYIAANLLSTEFDKIVNGPTVPAGKRLVIENASVWALTSLNDFVTGIWLTVPTASPQTFVLLDPADTERKPISGANAVAAYNRPVKLYFNPGEQLQLHVFTDGTAGPKLVNVYLNGYYVNLP